MTYALESSIVMGVGQGLEIMTFRYFKTLVYENFLKITFDLFIFEEYY